MTVETGGCGSIRDQLGELLVGALDDEASGRVEAHLLGCDACSHELAGLLETEELLTRGEELAHVGSPLTARPRWQGWLAFAAAAAVLLLTGALLLSPAEPSERLLFGRLLFGRLTAAVGTGATLQVGAALERGARLTAPAEGVLQLADGSLIAVAAGAQLELVGPRVIRLDAGRVEINATANEQRFFAVRTVRGTARTHETSTGPGTSFRVEVQEDEMYGKTMKAAGAAGVVVVSVIAGMVVFDSGDGLATTRVEAGQRVVATQDGVERLEPRAAAEEPAVAVQELESLRTTNAKLEAEMGALADERKALKIELAAVREELTTLQAAAESGTQPEGASAPRGTLPVEFGRWSDVEELSGTDWKTTAAAVKTLAGALTRENLLKLLRGMGPWIRSPMA